MKDLFCYVSCILICMIFNSCNQTKTDDWAWIGFERPEGINPIISPVKNTFFYCPLTQDSVA